MTNNLATQLYQTLVQPATMRALLAGFFRDDRDQAIALLQKNGVAISSTASPKDVRVAWLKAIKDSGPFREQAAALLTSYIMMVTGQTAQMNNFVGNLDVVRYYNDVTDVSSIDPNSFSTAALAGSSSATDSNSSMAGIFSTDTSGEGAALNVPTIAPTVPSSSSSSSSSSSGSGDIWSSLSSIFTPKLIQQGISTGLQAYSTNLTAQANQTSERNALAIEQAQLAQAQVKAQAQQAGTGSKMMLWLVGGGVVVVGLVVVLLVARRK